ncbi:MAG: hypothetical protein R3E50_07940 [Halioglobus sp.]
MADPGACNSTLTACLARFHPLTPVVARHYADHLMNKKVQDLLNQIRELEDELRVTIQAQEAKLSYQIEGSKIRFDQAVKSAHKRLKTNIFTWLRESRPQSLLSAPFVYGMVVPIGIFDLALTIYQAVCFRLYDIPQVVRSDYVVIDRHHLAYLNAIEKLNCIYCGYGNGVINYAREIISRTEQYWCPIKHARKVIDAHGRYRTFLNYGDATAYPVKLVEFRTSLREAPETKTPDGS